MPAASWLPGATTTYTYDDAGRLQTALLPSATGITTTYGYDDPANYLASVTHTKAGAPPTTISAYNYGVNPNGNRTQMTDATGMTSYGYDSLDRLSSVTYPGPTQTQYGYDGNSNRLTTQVDANPAVPYVSDAADQLTSIGGANQYDLNGDLTQIGDDTQTFLYDQAGRPLRIGPCRGDVDDSGSITISDVSRVSSVYLQGEGNTGYDLNFDMNGDGTINISDLSILTADYLRMCHSNGAGTGEGDGVYNADGLRIREQTFPAAGPTTDDYVWDQGASLPEILQDTRTQSGVASTTTYLYGLNGPMAETDGSGTTSYYLADGLGSTTQLTDISGKVTDSYTYDAFGAMTSHTGTNPQPFMYTGQQQDVGAARSLVYLRARSYDPALGRFVSKDPVSFNQRYSYVGNDPANRVDPTGLLGWKSVIHVGSAVVDTATAAGAGAVAAVSDCARSHTCTSTVATIGLVAGSVTGQPWLIGASIGVLAASDSASCAQGNKVSCALAAADVVTIGATGLRAYGYAGAVVVGDLTPAEAMLQLTSAEIFNDTYRLALSSRAGVSLALLGFVFDGRKERP